MIRLGIQDDPSAPSQTSAKASGDPQPSLDESQAQLKDRLQLLVGERFEVLDPVALGGMATIFQLRHRQHGGLFAAKVLREELTDRPEVIASFRREAMHAARLGDHPNAIPILDAGDDHGLFFLLMPFVEGEDLDQLLRQQGPFERAEALHLGAQIGSLLCHAESHGITHCDVAPGNIRLDIFGRYRLMDFGISLGSDEPPRRSLGGTPLYTSPEQLRGEVPDVRADIYALGLVLGEVLTGKPLMQATTLPALREQHLGGDWRLPAPLEADEPLARLLRRMLATDREKRFSSAFELSGALAAMGFTRPEFRPRPAAARPGAPSTRRSRLS